MTTNCRHGFLAWISFSAYTPWARRHGLCLLTQGMSAMPRCHDATLCLESWQGMHEKLFLMLTIYINIINLCPIVEHSSCISWHFWLSGLGMKRTPTGIFSNRAGRSTKAVYHRPLPLCDQIKPGKGYEQADDGWISRTYVPRPIPERSFSLIDNRTRLVSSMLKVMTTLNKYTFKLSWSCAI